MVGPGRPRTKPCDGLAATRSVAGSPREATEPILESEPDLPRGHGPPRSGRGFPTLLHLPATHRNPYEAVTVQCMSSVVPTSAPSPTGRRRPWGPRAGHRGRFHRGWAQALRDTVYILSGFVLATAWWSLLVTLLAVGLGLLVTLVGIPILVATLYIWMGIADTERWRARTLLGIEVPRPYRTLGAPTTLRRIWERTKDPAVWRDLVYLLLVFFPLAIATFVIAVTVWAVAIAFVAMPAYYGSGSGVQFGDGSRLNVDTLPEALACSLVGLVLLALVPWILGLLAAAARTHGADAPRPPLGRAGRGADAAADRGGRRCRLRAAAHRARPPRRGAAAVDCARDRPRTRPGQARLRPGERKGARRAGARGLQAGARGAAQPCPRDPPCDPHRPRPRCGALGPRGAEPDSGRDLCRPRHAADGRDRVHGVFRGRRGSDERHQARRGNAARSSHPPRERSHRGGGRGQRRRRRPDRARRRSRRADDAGCHGRRHTHDLEPRGGPTVVRAELPCAS